MRRRLLIVTADDVGLHAGMTAGAIHAHREGIVTACSVVANGAAFEDAVARLREVPSLEVGVHLTLVEERALTGMRFPRKWTSFVPLYLVRALSLRAIEAELRAQVERVLDAGLRVTHLNGHQHLHLLPRIFDVVTRLADVYAIPYVRIVNDRGSPSRRLPIAALSALGRRAAQGTAGVLAGWDAGVPPAPGRRRGTPPDQPPGRRRSPVDGRRSNDYTIGVADAGHLTDVVPLLDHVEGVTELVTHPGLGVEGYTWNYDWDAETRALCDPRLRDELSARAITLVSPTALPPPG